MEDYKKFPKIAVGVTDIASCADYNMPKLETLAALAEKERAEEDEAA